MTPTELNTLAEKIADIICQRIGIAALDAATQSSPHPLAFEWVSTKKVKNATGIPHNTLYNLKKHHPEIHKSAPKSHPNQQRSKALWNLPLIQKILTGQQL